MHTNTTSQHPETPSRPRLLLALALLASMLLVGGISLTGPGWNRAAMDAAISQQSTSSGPQDQTVQAPTPWYRTPWAMAAYGLGTVGILVLLVRHRTANLERKREELERLVTQRTEEVREQKHQLETYNRELLRTNEALRHTVEEKSKLLGMAAHDLKNPLFGIRALSEIVLESSDLSSNHERKLTLIRESADETLHLIDDLLASAANSAQSDLNTEDVDVAALAQWVVRSFEPQAQQKDQALRCSVTDAPCVVRGDKRKLREAIGNLVSNALKYSPCGEEIDIVVDRAESLVDVAVADAGPGLSDTDQQRMFAPFQRLSAEPTGGEGSSGLGLYIVKQIANLHDGTVDVDTVLGEGSTFTLRLPATSPNASPVPETDPTDLEIELEASNV